MEDQETKPEREGGREGKSRKSQGFMAAQSPEGGRQGPWFHSTTGPPKPMQAHASLLGKAPLWQEP